MVLHVAVADKCTCYAVCIRSSIPEPWQQSPLAGNMTSERCEEEQLRFLPSEISAVTGQAAASLGRAHGQILQMPTVCFKLYLGAARQYFRRGRLRRVSGRVAVLFLCHTIGVGLGCSCAYSITSSRVHDRDTCTAGLGSSPRPWTFV